MTAKSNNPYGKTWQNFYAKLTDRPECVEYWNHYHLLGYWIEQTLMPLEPEHGIDHSRHPQLKKMHTIIAQVMNPELYRLPKFYDSVKVKAFLDWCVDDLNKNKMPCHSLSIIIGDKRNRLEQWRYSYDHQKIETTFNPNLLDLGE
jgi:hypothetical protein